MEDPDEMEMPVKCRCGEWFDLHDGFSCKWKNETVCESCHELQTEIEDLKEEIMDLENDIANDIQKRDNKRRLKLAKEELKNLKINIMNHIFNEIRSERQRQDEKWGQQDHKPIEWVAILTEEVGEVAKEAVDLHFDNNLQGLNALSKFEEQRQRLLNYRKELIQVAAVSVSMIQCLDRHMEALDLI